MKNIHLIDHPLIQHKLSLMRKKSCNCAMFRSLMKEISLLLAYEVTRNLPVKYESITTPLSTMKAPFLSDKETCIISILRAGNGILDGFLFIKTM